ncbi:hypothetical protein FACS1894216_01300 [Synergistales bacterium]|nr:hypothetical protein FACS1894216_01300 [Synergistales bacterium]
MATNDFKPFATDPLANLISQEVWESAQLRPMGNVQGSIANSALVNKALRQATEAAAMIGEFIASKNLDALDNANVSALRDNFEAALTALVGSIVPKVDGVLPKGGLAGQVLAKNSQADYDAKWIPAPIGGEGNIDLSEIYAQLAILKSLMNVTDIIVGDSAIAEQARNWDTYFVGILEDVSAGAASILVPAGNALYPFSEYTLISPEAVEVVQIDSVELIDGNIKVNLAAPLENGYPAQSLLARSTLGISGVAGASPGQMKQTNTWFVNETWTGTSNTVPNTVPLNVSLGQSSSYDMDANIQIQVGGLISLQAS